MWRCDGGARRLIALLAVVAALAGCATPVPPAQGTSTASTVREWGGRFSVMLQSDQPGGRQDAAAGRFSLVARPAPAGRRLDIELVSPFGQTIANGRREPDGASTLTLSNGRTLAAPSLDAVLEQALGWPLPIERLPDWLDDRFERVLTRDAQGGVASALDSGWRIEREPRRWALQRPHDGGLLRVVLVLDR